MLLGLSCAALATQAEAQIVSGRVSEETSDSALEAVSVSLLLRSTEVAARTITDGRGRYVLRAPGPGDYRVVADHLGFQRLESPLARIAADQAVTIDFELPVDPIELEGIDVEVQRLEELKQRAGQYGVAIEHIGGRFVPRTEIEKRLTERNIGGILQWQNWAGVRVRWSDDPPRLCVRAVAGRVRCAITVLDGIVVTDEVAALVPPEALEAVILLTPMEATLSFGTDGGGGAVLLFTRANVAGR